MSSDNGIKRVDIHLEGFTKEETNEIMEHINSIRQRMTSSRSDFIKTLCDFSMETSVWAYLWENGPTRFTDLVDINYCSKGKMSSVLKDLQRANLVTLRYKLYEAIVPDWLAHDD
jgi:DNA-binding transcriptional regulator GbsR (MarR family)